jgi:DNA helicase HerA-like ATPase
VNIDRSSTALENRSALHERHVGVVLSVRGSQASVGLLQRSGEFPSLESATVGNFLAIVSKRSILIGFITQVSVKVPEIVAHKGYSGSARLDLMGEIRTEAGSSRRFLRGITQYPHIGDPVVAIGSNELRVVYGKEGDESINIGQLQQDQTLPAYVHVDEMMSGHFAVFGTTGVGKSSGIVAILQEVLRVRPNVRIFLLDAHNEYDRCFNDKAQVLNPANLRLPFWLFNFEETIDVIFGGRPGVEEETEILAELIPVAKAVYVQYRESPSRPGVKRADPKAAGFTADTPVPYRLADLLSLIDERMGKLENRSSRMKYHRLIMRIETVSIDPRYTFMFDNANVGGDTMAEVICRLFRVPPRGKPMTIMQLVGFPAEVVDSVVSVLARMAFDFGLWSEGAYPMLFVCEEAHRYAPADRSLGFGPTRRALSRIAKEGRKYGIFLGIASQRPAELDPTIISQCSTLFAMRMANDRDQEIIGSAVSDAAANLVSLLPSLGTREVLAFGEGVALPARIAFAQLPEHLIPTSRVKSNSRPVSIQPGQREEEHVESVVARWRGASSFKQSFQRETAVVAPAMKENAQLQAPARPSSDRLSLLRKSIALGSETTVRPRRTAEDDPTRWPL